MDPVLSVHGLVKNYGSVQAVADVSFEVYEGQVCGILGPNGSGKTTTLSIIMGAVRSQKGTFVWNLPGQERNPNLSIGTLIEAPNFYPYLSLSDNLKICAMIKQVSNGDIRRVLEMTGLFERRNSKYHTLSLGMKQRLGIAATLLGDPQVLVLDEPANGLDPEGIADIRKIIQDEAGKGKTILMASHILDEVEKVCTHAVVLKKGKVIGSGRVDDLLSREEQIIVRCDQPEMMIGVTENQPGIRKVVREGEDIVFYADEHWTTGRINKLAFDNGIILSQLIHRKPTLESQFLELVREEQY